MVVGRGAFTSAGDRVALGLKAVALADLDGWSNLLMATASGGVTGHLSGNVTGDKP
jgi:hypothetical protein